MRILTLVLLVLSLTAISGCSWRHNTPWAKYGKKTCERCAPVTSEQTDKILRGMLAEDAMKILGRPRTVQMKQASHFAPMRLLYATNQVSNQSIVFFYIIVSGHSVTGFGFTNGGSVG